MWAVYITHPEVNIDPEVPVPQWGLSPRGQERARLAAQLPWAGEFRRIVSSDETKAIETAAILAAPHGLTPEILHQSGENDRSATGFLPPDRFQAAADWFFAHPDQSFHGWERAVDAQARIVAAVEALLAGHDRTRPLAIIGHGGVGTLLKCHIKAVPISRTEDQTGSGGQCYAFRLEDRRLLCDWTAIESWEGPRP